jgi:hypothetical protein
MNYMKLSYTAILIKENKASSFIAFYLKLSGCDGSVHTNPVTMTRSAYRIQVHHVAPRSLHRDLQLLQPATVVLKNHMKKLSTSGYSVGSGTIIQAHTAKFTKKRPHDLYCIPCRPFYRWNELGEQCFAHTTLHTAI